MLLTTPAMGAEPPQHFPTYPSIQENVKFWEDIYSKYSTTQGILHDKNHPGIVYTVIALAAWDAPGAAAINEERIKDARQQYQGMLKELGTGRKPQTAEEERLAGLMKKYGISFHQAHDTIRLQTGQKDRFLQGVIRSGAWIGEIQRILRSHGLPPELAYLPHVESSFNQEAHSKAAAVGIWQFTRATGLEYMTINQLIDERYDVLISTEAAAKLLKENHRQLGSWPLALTAYNYGRSGMVRAQQAHGDYEKILKHHKGERFGFASRNFYAEFLAALQVARKLEKDPLVVRQRPAAIRTFRLRGYAAAEDLCRHFGLAREDFTRLNPALLEPVLSGKKYVPKGYLLRLPASKRTAGLAASFPARLYRSHQVRDTQHMVTKGDTAHSIARRYGIAVGHLLSANQLDRKTSLRIGQKLKIPITGEKNDQAGVGKKPVTGKTTEKRGS